MATKKPKGTTSAKKAAPDLFNQPKAKASKAKSSPKPKAQAKAVTAKSSNLPAVRQSTLPAVKARNLPVKYEGKAVTKSLANRMGSALSKNKGRAGMLGKALLGAGAAYAAYKAGKSSSSETETPKKSKPVSILKGVNRRDDVGKPLTPTVLKKGNSPKPTTPKPKPSNPKKQEVKPKATPEFKRDAQISNAKTLGAKDIKPTYAKMPEVKNVNLSKPSTDKPKYSKERIARMEKRAERKSERMEKRASKMKPKMKMGGVVKAKNGKSFPDLNKDGKITKADILKGRGVIAKKGASVKAKSGTSMKKCKYGC